MARQQIVTTSLIPSHPMPRCSLRTLLVVLALGPPLTALAWFLFAGNLLMVLYLWAWIILIVCWRWAHSPANIA